MSHCKIFVSAMHGKTRKSHIIITKSNYQQYEKFELSDG